MIAGGGADTGSGKGSGSGSGSGSGAGWNAGPGSNSTSPAGSTACSGSGSSSPAAVVRGAFRRQRSGAWLRARISVRADDEPVFARCLFRTSCRRRSRRRCADQSPTDAPSVRAVSPRLRQKAARSWPGENRVVTMTVRNRMVRMMMIEPIRLKYSASSPVSAAPRYPPASMGRGDSERWPNARERNPALHPTITPRPSSFVYAAPAGRHQKACQPSTTSCTGTRNAVRPRI